MPDKSGTQLFEAPRFHPTTALYQPHETFSYHPIPKCYTSSRLCQHVRHSTLSTLQERVQKRAHTHGEKITQAARRRVVFLSDAHAAFRRPHLPLLRGACRTDRVVRFRDVLRRTLLVRKQSPLVLLSVMFVRMTTHRGTVVY